MNTNNEIYILGVGHNTGVYIDLVKSCGIKPVGLYHYNEELTGQKIYGIPVLGSYADLFERSTLEGMNFTISVGDNKIRHDLANQVRSLKGTIPTLIHPTAIVSRYSEYSEGVIIQANSIVQAGVYIETDTVISFNVSIVHSCSIGKACYLAARSIIGAYSIISNFVLIGIGAIIVSGKVDYIGENAIIGAGAVVTKSVEANRIVVGNPARLFND